MPWTPTKDVEPPWDYPKEEIKEAVDYLLEGFNFKHVFLGLDRPPGMPEEDFLKLWDFNKFAKGNWTVLVQHPLQTWHGVATGPAPQQVFDCSFVEKAIFSYAKAWPYAAWKVRLCLRAVRIWLHIAEKSVRGQSMGVHTPWDAWSNTKYGSDRFLVREGDELVDTKLFYIMHSKEHSHDFLVNLMVLLQMANVLVVDRSSVSWSSLSARWWTWCQQYPQSDLQFFPLINEGKKLYEPEKLERGCVSTVTRPQLFHYLLTQRLRHQLLIISELDQDQPDAQVNTVSRLDFRQQRLAKEHLAHYAAAFNWHLVRSHVFKQHGFPGSISIAKRQAQMDLHRIPYMKLKDEPPLPPPEEQELRTRAFELLNLKKRAFEQLVYIEQLEKKIKESEHEKQFECLRKKMRFEAAEKAVKVGEGGEWE